MIRAGLAALAASLLAGCTAPALVVASDLDNLPFAGVDEDGTPIGRDVEMMTQLGDALGRRIEWWRMPFEHLLPAVEAGDVDVVCATIGVTPERAERMAFTRPYYRTTIAVLVRAGPGEPTELADLAGRRVAAATGTTSERAVRAHLPDAIGVFATERELPTSERLLAREIDAAAMDGPAAAALVAASEGRLARLAEPLDEELYALAVPRRRKSLLRALDCALERIDLDALDARHGL